MCVRRLRCPLRWLLCILGLRRTGAVISCYLDADGALLRLQANK